MAPSNGPSLPGATSADAARGVLRASLKPLPAALARDRPPEPLLSQASGPCEEAADIPFRVDALPPRRVPPSSTPPSPPRHTVVAALRRRAVPAVAQTTVGPTAAGATRDSLAKADTPPVEVQTGTTAALRTRPVLITNATRQAVAAGLVPLAVRRRIHVHRPLVGAC